MVKDFRHSATAEVATPAAMPAPVAVPPYVPYRSFRNFIDSLKQGIPSRIDRSVMPSMSGALQSQLTAALKYLGLITTGGHPTEALTNLVNSEGPERASVLTEILKNGYPFLRKPAFELQTATPRMMQEQFAKEGAGGGTIDKCINFFLSAAKDAGIEVSPHLKRMRGTRIARSRRLRNDSGMAGANGADEFTDVGEMSWAQMLLSKFPSFDPAWPDEVKVKWFDGFHRLMRMKLEEEKEES